MYATLEMSSQARYEFNRESRVEGKPAWCDKKLWKRIFDRCWIILETQRSLVDDVGCMKILLDVQLADGNCVPVVWTFIVSIASGPLFLFAQRVKDKYSIRWNIVSPDAVRDLHKAATFSEPCWLPSNSSEQW